MIGKEGGYPNLSFLESDNAQIVMNKIRKSFISNQVSFVYEDVCRQKMWEMNANGAWPFNFSKIGRYWDNKTEIDIAALDPDGKNLVLGECKYWKEEVGINVLMELEEKSKSVNWNLEKRNTWFIIFSAGGFTEELKALAAKREDLILAQ